MEDRKPNPKLLVTWAIAGAFLAASTWLMSFVPIPRLHANGCGFWDVLWMNRLRFVAFFTPFTLGLAISFGAERRFKRGFLSDLWSEAELEPVKVLLAYPIWTSASLILMGIGLLAMISTAPRTHFSGVLFYILLIPSQTAMRLRQLVTPRVNPTGGLIDWQNFKRIHSDQWGQPPVHSSE